MNPRSLKNREMPERVRVRFSLARMIASHNKISKEDDGGRKVGIVELERHRILRARGGNINCTGMLGDYKHYWGGRTYDSERRTARLQYLSHPDNGSATQSWVVPFIYV